MLKNNQLTNNKIIIAVAAILAASALTYWQIVRPHMVTKNCHDIALDNSGYNEDSWRSWAGDQRNQSNYMFVYEMCMQKEGLNP